MDMDVYQSSTPVELSTQPGIEATSTTDATGPQSLLHTYIQCGKQANEHRDANHEVDHPTKSPRETWLREMHSDQNINENPLQWIQKETELRSTDVAHLNGLRDKILEPIYDNYDAESSHESFKGDHAVMSTSTHVANSDYVTNCISLEGGRNGDVTLCDRGKKYKSSVSASLFSTIVVQHQPQETSDIIHEDGLENPNLQSKPSSFDDRSFPSDFPSQKEDTQELIFHKSKQSRICRSRQQNSVCVRGMEPRKRSEEGTWDFKRWTSPRRSKDKFEGSNFLSLKKGRDSHSLGKCGLQDTSLQDKPTNGDSAESDDECPEETLRSFRDRLLLQKQAESLETKTTGKTTGWKETKGNTTENMELPAQGIGFSVVETPQQSDEISLAKSVKTPKDLVRDIVRDALLEAGFKIELKPRQSRDYCDSVYVSPAGHSYWSLPKAWEALKKESNEIDHACHRNQSLKGSFNEVNRHEEGISHSGQMHALALAEKSTLEQVLLWFGKDKRLISAFKKLGSFPGVAIHDIIGQVEVTNAKLADILLVELGLLRRLTKKSRERQACLSPTLIDNNEGRKRKRDTVKSEKCKMRLKQVKNVLQVMPQVSKSTNMSLFEVVQKGCRKEKVNKKSLSKITKTKLAKKKPSSKKGEKAKPRARFRLEVRSADLNIDATTESSCSGKLTVFSWMIDRGAMMEKEKIFSLDNFKNQTLKEGVVTREGILCRCCKKLYTIHAFKSHGRSHRKPAHELAFSSGRSILDCQLEAWTAELNLRRTHNYVGVSVDDTNDDTCLLCGDGGDLICCDQCPSTFHMSCLGIDNLPEGSWYCPKCRCGICSHNEKKKGKKSSMVQCSQCERHYHVGCLQGGLIVAGKYYFCSRPCRKIFSRLRQLLGVSNPLTGGLTWTLLRCMDEDREVESIKIKTRMEHHSKLAVALLVVKECFNPMIDPRTNIDMITHALYNRRSEFDRLNYTGFYTAVLEREGEIISAATIRVHGARIAEMPLIGTRQQHRRKGMCRLLVGAIEELLRTLDVSTFILPAIPDLFDTWTHVFGFQPLHASQRLEIRDLSMMLFPGTELLQKSLLEIPEDAVMDLKKESVSALTLNNGDDDGIFDASKRLVQTRSKTAVCKAMDFSPENSTISSPKSR